MLMLKSIIISVAFSDWLYSIRLMFDTTLLYNLYGFGFFVCILPAAGDDEPGPGCEAQVVASVNERLGKVKRMLKKDDV